MPLSLVALGVQREHSSSKLRVQLSTSVHNPTGKYVNANDVKPLGNVRPLEKPSVTAYRDPIVNVERKLAIADTDILLTAFLTKFPNYQLREKVYSTVRKRVTYWFYYTLNGERMTRVFTRNQVMTELEKAL